jgi:hypothetical protein
MTTLENPNATVPDSVEVPRIGALQYELGFPTPETSRKLFDEMDFQRAVQAYLWAYPAVSFESIRLTLKEHLDIGLNDLGIADNLVDPKSVWLTANDTTIYAVVNLDVAQGPVVIEIPPGAIVGLLDDFWQRSLVDVGLPGPDAGKGGKFLVLPPGYDGEVPSDYYEVRATMHNHNLLVRGIVVDNDVPDAVERIRNVKIYPWSEHEDPKPNKFVSISGALIDTSPPGGMQYWERLAAVIDNNPVQERDRFHMAMLKPLGIEKGQPFKPDPRQQAMLEDAAVLGDAMARNLMYEGTQRETGATAFPGTQWDWVIYPVKPSQEAEHYSQLDERTQYFYGAIYLSPGIGVMKAGPGANYIQAFKDKDGNHFDGGKSYRLHVPSNPPVAAFWSLTAYDSATRSMVQNPTNDAAHSSYDELNENEDGSFDMYFGPEAPAGQESNWVETVPGRGFYPMFRLYSPTEPLFDGTWALPDVELT